MRLARRGVLAFLAGVVVMPAKLLARLLKKDTGHRYIVNFVEMQPDGVWGDVKFDRIISYDAVTVRLGRGKLRTSPGPAILHISAQADTPFDHALITGRALIVDRLTGQRWLSGDVEGGSFAMWYDGGPTRISMSVRIPWLQPIVECPS